MCGGEEQGEEGERLPRTGSHYVMMMMVVELGRNYQATSRGSNKGEYGLRIRPETLV